MLILCEEAKQFCRWNKTGRSGWQITWLNSHSEGLWQAGEMDQQRCHEVPEFMPCSTQAWGSNFMNPSRLGVGRMESSFPGKITDILVENKLNVSQQHPLQSGLHFKRVLPAAQRRWLFLSAQPWWDTSVVLGPVLGSPLWEEHTWAILTKKHEGYWGIEHLTCEERQSKLGSFGLDMKMLR